MPGEAERICNAINGAIRHLVEVGWAVDQKYAFRSDRGGRTEVTYPDSGLRSLALKEVRYEDLYDMYREERSYNVRMIDGAMLQLSYIFEGEYLRWHRLAFLPSPSLEVFQNDPEIYQKDGVYADFVDPRVVSIPCRFDFDEYAGSVDHPASHLTLGQYKNCRIPVTSPVPPGVFFEFVLRSFYNNPHSQPGSAVSIKAGYYNPCIDPSHRNTVHIAVP